MRVLTLQRPVSVPRRHLSRQNVHHAPHRFRKRHVLRAESQGSGLSPEFKTALDNLISGNKIVVFMKGTKQFPQCGFSNTVVQILNELKAPFEAVDILETDLLRQGMKEYSQWPTFPQVYIDGQFYGGCDIMIESYQSGDLQEVIEKSMNS